MIWGTEFHAGHAREKERVASKMLMWQEECLRASALECEGSHCLGFVQGILRALGRTSKSTYGICVVAKS